MSHGWERISALFAEAATRIGGERSRFLDEQCLGDSELRREVESLLEHDASAGDYLTPPLPAHADVGIGPAAGSTIGGFRLLRQLGAGGMGSVYEAEQIHPQRRVALKVLPPLTHDPGVLRRFVQEAELLARMNHSSIAQIYATGVDGTAPFFAMELVKGALTITEYARRRALSVADSMALFRHVCAAIAHGHAKGVVHRDIKPGNLLVDEQGEAKVIDFGIARALDVAEGDAARMTRTGDLVGTLQYMSPEQAEGRIADVDAQSDVHALGLVLYEMVCGSRAYAIEGQPLTSALRVISQDQIPPARSKRADLPAEVEWILGKALEKDRARRYASVVEFDSDLARFLAHEPVLAGPPSRIYTARKFVRRHRVGVAALAAVFLALTIGLVVALRERGRAEDARDQLAERARELEVETARKDRILDFQNRLLTAASPDAEGYDVRVVDLLDLARKDLETSREEPEVALELHGALSQAYSSLGRMDAALAESSAALAMARGVAGISPLRVAAFERLNLDIRATRGVDASITAEMRALVAHDIERFGTGGVETVRARDVLARHLLRSGSLDEAEQVARTTLDQCPPSLVDEIAGLRLTLATTLMQRARFAEGEDLLRLVVEVGNERAGPLRRRTLTAQSLLIDCLSLRGAAQEAERLARASVDVYEQRAGPEHVETIRARLIHGLTLLEVGRVEECLQILHDVLASTNLMSRADTIDVLDLRQRIGTLLDQSGKSEEAVPILRMVHAQRMDKGLSGAVETVQVATGLAGALRRTGRHAEAEAVARDAAVQGEERHGREARVVVAAYHQLALILLEQGLHSEATAALAVNVGIWRRTSGPEHDDTLRGLEVLARAFSSGGRHLEAEQVIREALAIRVANFGADHARTLQSRRILGVVLNASGQIAEAESEFCEIAAAWGRAEGLPGRVVDICSMLATVRTNLGRDLDALAAYRTGCEAALALPPDSAVRIDVTMRLAEQWLKLDQPDPVPGLLEPILESCFASGTPRARSCSALLLESYDRLGRGEDAAALRERLESKGS